MSYDVKKPMKGIKGEMINSGVARTAVGGFIWDFWAVRYTSHKRSKK